jgi:hypothetical protein
VPWMDMGFAVTCQLARHRRPHHPVLVHRPLSLLHACFGPHLAVTPLRFATLHLHQVGTGLTPVAAEHARRTKKKRGKIPRFAFQSLLARFRRRLRRTALPKTYPSSGPQIPELCSKWSRESLRRWQEPGAYRRRHLPRPRSAA